MNITFEYTENRVLNSLLGHLVSDFCDAKAPDYARMITSEKEMLDLNYAVCIYHRKGESKLFYRQLTSLFKENNLQDFASLIRAAAAPGGMNGLIQSFLPGFTLDLVTAFNIFRVPAPSLFVATNGVLPSVTPATLNDEVPIIVMLNEHIADKTKRYFIIEMGLLSTGEISFSPPYKGKEDWRFKLVREWMVKSVIGNFL